MSAILHRARPQPDFGETLQADFDKGVPLARTGKTAHALGEAVAIVVMVAILALVFVLKFWMHFSRVL